MCTVHGTNTTLLNMVLAPDSLVLLGALGQSHSGAVPKAQPSVCAEGTVVWCIEMHSTPEHSLPP